MRALKPRPIVPSLVRVLYRDNLGKAREGIETLRRLHRGRLGSRDNLGKAREGIETKASACNPRSTSGDNMSKAREGIETHWCDWIVLNQSSHGIVTI